jgi:hypothetical protein
LHVHPNSPVESQSQSVTGDVAVDGLP